MRVTVVRDAGLDRESRRAATAAGLAPLLRRCGDELQVAARASLTLRLTDDANMRRLNRDFRDVDEPTDVLAFPFDEPDRIGDIAISVERALGQSSDGAAELRLLSVHGLLHCLGYDHGAPDAAADMTALTRRLLPLQCVPSL